MYDIITLQDLVDFVNNNPETFKKGMKTPIWSGDFEGNYTHILHSIQVEDNGDDKVLFVGYEMHEDFGH